MTEVGRQRESGVNPQEMAYILEKMSQHRRQQYSRLSWRWRVRTEQNEGFGDEHIKSLFK